MSCWDCPCFRRTSVDSITLESQSEASIQHYLGEELPAQRAPLTAAGDGRPLLASNASHYELRLELGRGFNNLTTIYLARNTPTGRMVTVRLTDLEQCSDEHLKLLQNEVIMTQFFRHPNILTFSNVFTTGSHLWVIAPFKAYGSAGQLLRTCFPEGMSETLIAHILHEAVKGLNYLHKSDYIHRNLKASHILISREGAVCLSGLNRIYSLVHNGQKSKVAYEFPESSTAVLPWLSPELLRQDMYGYNVKSDIYSVGITACELANGGAPFQNMHRTQMLLQKLRGPACCLLDTHYFPCGESRMKISRSGVDSGIGESVLTSAMTGTMTSDGLQTPASRMFSSSFRNFVELCLQQEPEHSSAGFPRYSFNNDNKLHIQQHWTTHCHRIPPVFP
ncbi:STE20-related kinase adapter protein beta isoform X2 [Ambystoma mexicanum]|uniref:STE20-related kinase adapter protein beta isoform X2 n=1 Tax=Ambystoma mexicanum TaxID=8296 RepID=UPI0037E7AFB5